MKTLTVSIVNYRTPQLVVECVASLKRFPPSRATLAIAVVDNASGDDSVSVIAQQCPDIQLIASPNNLGFGGGNNLILRGLRSDYVLLLNSDAQVEAGTLDRLIEVLELQPQVGAVSGRVVNASDGADQDFPCRFPSLTQMVKRMLTGPQFPANGQSAPISLERLHGACMLIRGELLHSVGLFDEGFFMYDEDVDWCVRARNAGWELLLVPDARILHHGGSSSGRAPAGQRRQAPSETALRMRYELRRSRYRLYRKHRSLAEVLLLKLLTDLVMLAASAKTLLAAVLQPARREEARALLRANARVMSINPLRIEVVDHGV
ncbi:glycosyltransferase family 2 protein [Pseudomonas sp. P5_152]|uniref:glycosyltransferase family 2 protein n=1 Tax=unclassified Pseudomonas TaxID=196821 RepID=UPI00131FC0F1|nr:MULTISPECIES: glycosyltransferase family 2 protein [unclassified Pseudomonas]MDX9666544.1 glycosyltransferase family 2 protein [Pseudomonas sp. P5_152]QHC99274.1 hypothetical protein PspS04_02395 [Pseudomonas sp. S04]QHF31760.1 hypothetical protein PspS19_02395 [Pseudomonas sp. S19]